MRTLVLYYSNTGNSQKVAEALSRQLGAELGEITCDKYLRWFGPLAMAWDIFTRSRPRVEVVAPPHAHYDLVIVGGPIWAARPAPPVMSALAGHIQPEGRIGLFVTCKGTDPTAPPDLALEAMAALIPGRVVARHAFREAEVRSGSYQAAVTSFAAEFGGPSAA